MSIIPAPTYSWEQRWANADNSNDDESISSLADEEPTEAEEEMRAQCWLRDTSLASQLDVSATQFYPTHFPSAPLAPEPTPNYANAGGPILQDLTAIIGARVHAMEANFHLVIDAQICAMEATFHSALQAMKGRLNTRFLYTQYVLITVAKDPYSLRAETIHSAMEAME